MIRTIFGNILLVFMVGLFILVGWHGLTSPSKDPIDLRNLRNQVVTIKQNGVSSGVFINETTILTNEHVAQHVNNFMSLETYGSDDKQLGVVTHIHPDYDLALIEVMPTLGKTQATAILDCSPVKFGSELVTIGSSENLRFNYNEFFVSTYQYDFGKFPEHIATNLIKDFNKTGPNGIMLTGQVFSGNSGSPVFDRLGYVRGSIRAVLFSTERNRSSLNAGLAVSTVDICPWLDELNIEYERKN